MPTENIRTGQEAVENGSAMRELVATATLTYTTDDIETMAREISFLREQVSRLQRELADAHAIAQASEASELGRTLLAYVLDVICALLHPQRGGTIVAGMVDNFVRTETGDRENPIGPLQMVLERAGLNRAISGQATRMLTRYEAVLWLPIMQDSKVAVILCLRRGPNTPFSLREQEIGAVLGPLVISALQTGHQRFQLHEDQEALRSITNTLGVAIRAAGGRLGVMEHDAERLAQSFRLGREEIAAVRMAAILHDIGTVDLAEDIIQKEGTLSANEVAQMREHPAFGAEIARQLPDMEAVIPVIYYHHERWDGKGYPAGISGTQIPIGARIIATVDAFNAMTSPRAYRSAFSVDEALTELERCAGTQFDPQVVQEFVRQVREGN